MDIGRIVTLAISGVLASIIVYNLVKNAGGVTSIIQSGGSFLTSETSTLMGK